MNYQVTAAGIQMNEPWSIPRASLGSITSNLSQNSNPSSIKIHNKKLSQGSSNRGYHSEGSDESPSERERRRNNRAKQQNHTLAELQNKFDEYSMKQQKHQHSKLRRQQHKIENTATPANPKRGSRSSQGSTDSNHSSHSASSGSLLLTAANLERFTHIQKKLPDIESCNKVEYDSHQHYKTNITLSSNNKKHFDHHQQHHQKRVADHIAVPIDPNISDTKTKDVDTISIASSTHFTMVNGMGGPQRVSSGGICSRGHQITILIVSMSMLFLIGIIFAVYLLEMRAREMPHL